MVDVMPSEFAAAAFHRVEGGEDDGHARKSYSVTLLRAQSFLLNTCHGITISEQNDPAALPVGQET
jgi:hypothetical protein